jgi:serine/threonine protein kinase
MAPELWSVDTEYDNNVDCWALGCMTYLLFAKTKPFDGPANITEKDLKRKILYDEPSFNNKNIWKNVNPKAIDFIKKCLTKNYKERPNADILLKDDWILEHNPRAQHYDFMLDMAKRMAAFKKTSIF